MTEKDLQIIETQGAINKVVSSICARKRTLDPLIRKPAQIIADSRKIAHEISTLGNEIGILSKRFEKLSKKLKQQKLDLKSKN